MTKLRELNYQELTKKIKKFGFRHYRSGKGSHELWVRETVMVRSFQFHITKVRLLEKELLELLYGK